MSRAISALVLVSFASCGASDEFARKTLIGATALTTSGTRVTPAVLVTAGSRIERLGTQAETPVPAGSEKLNLMGKFLVAEPVPIPDRPDLPHVRSWEEARGAGAPAAIFGAPLDQPPGDLAFLTVWRDQGTVLVPRLGTLTNPDDLSRALINTRRIHYAGVSIAAGAGADLALECELLAKAGLRATEIVDAATKNAARAAGVGDDAGTLAAGYRASLLVLSGNPLDDIANLGRVEKRMREGEWVP